MSDDELESTIENGERAYRAELLRSPSQVGERDDEEAVTSGHRLR